MELTKKQLAFVEAIKCIGGIPKDAAIKYFEDDRMYESEYSDYYTIIADCWLMFELGIEHERKRCMIICEGAGFDGLDSFHCLDVIGSNHEDA